MTRELETHRSLLTPLLCSVPGTLKWYDVGLKAIDFTKFRNSCNPLFPSLSVSLSLSVCNQQIPKGHESEFFSFYEVTDKGTAWLGPLVVGIVNDQTGSMRNAIMSMAAFFVIGLVLLARVDVDSAVTEKHDFEEQHQVTAKERLSLLATDH